MDERPRLLACIDLSDHGGTVLRTADRLAGLLGADLHVLHVAEGEPAFMGWDEPLGPRDLADHAVEVEHERTRLDALVAEVGTASPTELLVVAGPIVDAVRAVADALDVAMVVVGREGHGGLLDRLMGSVATDLVRTATRPVLVVPAAG